MKMMENIQQKIVKRLANKLSDKQKEEMIQKFYDQQKDREDVDILVKEMKRALKYDGEFEPE